jgi:Sulfotransferase domain
VTGADGRIPRVVALWSPPRCVSTAFFRMIAARGDFVMLHEPFADLAAKGEYDLAGTRVTSPAQAIDEIGRISAERPVFFKDTTEYRHAALFADPRLMELATHTFIVRDPRRAIESHYAMNPAVTLPEIGFENLHEIFGLVRAATGTVPPVVDADTLVRQPEQTVRAYCAAVGIPFDPQSLRWSPGERPEWRRTSHWHRDAAESSAFRESERRYEVRVDNDPALAAFYAHHLPFYRELLDFALPPQHES